MRLAAIALFCCSTAFGQSATPSAPTPSATQPTPLLGDLNPPDVKDQLKSKLRAMTPHMPLTSNLTLAPRVCAIPLLQALPAQGNVDYKMRVYTPPLPAPQQTAAPNAAPQTVVPNAAPQTARGIVAGIPACK